MTDFMAISIKDRVILLLFKSATKANGYYANQISERDD